MGAGASGASQAALGPTREVASRQIKQRDLVAIRCGNQPRESNRRAASQATPGQSSLARDARERGDWPRRRRDAERQEGSRAVQLATCSSGEQRPSPPRHVPRSSKASTSMQTKGLRPPSSLLCALRASAANLPLPTRPRGRTASHALLVLGVARCLESGAKSGRVALLVLLSRPPDGEG